MSEDRPSDAAIVERARSLANEAVFTVALQRRRLGSKEPEDGVFLFRWWADLQFFIVALRRLRRAAELASRVSVIADRVKAEISAFDDALPHLATMRNVGEHVDDYATDSPKRRHKSVTRRALAVGRWDGVTYRWLDLELNVDIALKEAERLYAGIGDLCRLVPVPDSAKR